MGKLKDILGTVLPVVGIVLSAMGFPFVGAMVQVVGAPARSTDGSRAVPVRDPDKPIEDSRDHVLRAVDIGLQVPIAYGPRAYIVPMAGVCLEPEVFADMPLLVDPDAEPEPGDMVVIHVRDPRAMGVANRRGATRLLEPDEIANPDPELAEELRELAVSVPGRWAYGKKLAAPLPPRETWADDTDYGLVVEMLNPRVELRAHLSSVLSVDKDFTTVRAGLSLHLN